MFGSHKKLQRVPLDFDYPLHEVWYGYRLNFCHKDLNNGCEQCRRFAKIMGIPMMPDEDGGCPNFGLFYNVEPPSGDGFQLWETTSEGSPVSPVFLTLEDLCVWCEHNATTYASFKATKDQWLKLLSENIASAQI